MSYPSVCCVNAWYGARSGARVPFPSRVAGHAQRCGQYGASRGGIRSQGDEGEERGRNRVALPARDAGNREAGFGSARANPPACRAAIGRVRGVPSADRVGAPNTQQGCHAARIAALYILYTRCNMHSAVQLASVIGSTSFEDTERGIRFADEELLLMPDEMPAIRFDEYTGCICYRVLGVPLGMFVIRKRILM